MVRGHSPAWVAAAVAALCAAFPDAVLADEAFLGRSFPHGGYDYAPSFMYGDGPEIRSWWCGQTAAGDVIFHSSWGSGGWRAAQIVLRPTPGTWDASHTCDPSVVMGAFTFGGSSYRYAMYYTGTDRPEMSGIRNRIGVAFSNDGIRWVKTASPVVVPADPATTSYGAGMPSAWSPEGSQVWLVYLDASASPANGIFLRLATDGLTFGAPMLTRLDGGRGHQGPDIAFDPDRRRWYAAVKWDADLNVILLQSCGDPVRGGDEILARWIEIGAFNGLNTGQPKNHNPGLLRWPSGDAYRDDTDNYFVQFGWGGIDPPSWDLAWGSFTEAPDADGDCHLAPADCDDSDLSVHPAAVETCNGRDDDCDGAVDEGVANPCGTCGPVPAEMCNGRDDDCDGVVDEDCIDAGPSPRDAGLYPTDGSVHVDGGGSGDGGPGPRTDAGSPDASPGGSGDLVGGGCGCRVGGLDQQTPGAALALSPWLLLAVLRLTRGERGRAPGAWSRS